MFFPTHSVTETKLCLDLREAELSSELWCLCTLVIRAYWLRVWKNQVTYTSVSDSELGFHPRSGTETVQTLVARFCRKILLSKILNV